MLKRKLDNTVNGMLSLGLIPLIQTVAVMLFFLTAQRSRNFSELSGNYIITGCSHNEGRLDGDDGRVDYTSET